jgi:ABC-type transport system involved in cytochrome c biogenesis permease subunit
MATQSVPGKLSQTQLASAEPISLRGVVLAVLHACASLKLTVTLFSLAIFLILVGTLAQTDQDMWEVLDQYFATWMAWINIQVFFPEAFFPGRPKVPDWHFLFPGGKIIGLAMVINLLAAHSIRFRVQARGSRLGIGLFVTAVGVGVTWLVIAAGHNKEGLQNEPFFEWSQFYVGLKILTGATVALLLYPLVKLVQKLKAEPRYLEVGLLAATIVCLLGVLIWMFRRGPLTPGDEASLRILWQLFQSTLAGVVLLVGAILIFGKRGGVVLIHAGIGLMMFSEFLVGVTNVEERMTIREGETAHYAEDIRTTELAIIDRSPEDHDDVVVIPRQVLTDSQERKKTIEHEDLPFDVTVVEYHKNSELRRFQEGAENPADRGVGLDYVVHPVRPSGGADADGAVDLASAYVRLTDKKTGEDLGTHLVSLLTSLQDHAEEVRVGDKTYEMFLRFRRSYKPYAMKLIDVVREDYYGTDTPRDYSSIVRVTDPDRNVDREVKIWMNNPLRYAGETFYQSHYEPGRDGIETTVFQVVRNTGWMIPYVACMIVAVGMLAHFWGTLLRFLTRREREIFRPEGSSSDVPASGDAAVASALDRSAHRPAKVKRKRTPDPESDPGRKRSGIEKWVPVVIALLGIVWFTYRLVPPREDPRSLDLTAFGQIPVHFEGRVKPLDSLARNSMRVISDRETFVDSRGERQPAIRWLADVIMDPDAALQHPVVRIDSLEVLQTLGLERRKGFRYAIEEFRERLDKLQEQVDLARATDARELSHYQRKVVEVDRRLRPHLMIGAAFRTPPLPENLPTEEELRSDPEKHVPVLMMVRRAFEVAEESEPELRRMKPPLIIPPQQGDEWQPYAIKWMDNYRAQVRNQFSEDGTTEELDEAAVIFDKIARAYATKDGRTFNAEVERLREYLAATSPIGFQERRVDFESFFNRYDPFFLAQWAYFVAFVLAALAWMGWSRPLNRASYWLIVLAVLVHTFALVARIYISGRPPVTNLYSSAVFIGWGVVLAGIFLETLYRMGVGNIVATVGGFTSLIIAGFLASSGETMTALQAVLDTQFWLATHVVCVTLGYSATYVAGFLGILYVVLGFCTKKLDGDTSRALSRMIYGTVCFALLFSFVGTVLGGLWADDSWGRFWGWDPKENGALIIVLWNAIVLHARWDGMVKSRGMAVLAIGGNIATSWSWFGVNELGVGLHSYGFTEGVLFSLGVFVLSQLAVIAVGCLPKEMWRSGDQLSDSAPQG